MLQENIVDIAEGDYVAAILHYYDSADEVQRAAGARWYSTAGELVRMIADDTGVDSEAVAYGMAALSPRNPWRWNVFDVWSYALAAAEGRTMPKANTFKRNQAVAWACVNGQVGTWATSAPKVRAFVAAILGDENSVVVDTWAVRVATFGAESRVRNDKHYVTLAHAYNVAANLRGVPPAVMQATTWIVGQTEGLATLRRGRHDLAFKAGTPEWLKEALTK